MLAPHPFGHEITETSLTEKFASFRQWEDRYRQLILLAKSLPALDISLRTPENELSGCENRVWLGAEKAENGTMHFYGDSEGRIVKGLLAVLLTAVEGKTPADILKRDPLALFDVLGLREQLSTSRSSGLNALAEGVIALARQAA
ncbi:cysteine desulfurase sulfur acceptor subunit CsdE [Rahnella sp. PCH160]|uniref:cysteine desulfurase sulfur acceptor subunit CsdE n=1 Tax=Rahnella sp. PCH160 TaxID=3447928 RepID=UPI0039FD6437